MPRVVRTDDEIACIIAAASVCGGGLRSKARTLGVPRTTLKQWIRGTRRPKALAMSPLKKAPLAEQLEQLAQTLIQEVYDNRADATWAQKVMAIGVAIDKMVRLRLYPALPPEGKPLRMDLTKLSEEQLQQFLQFLRLVSIPPEPAVDTPALGDSPG